MAPTRTAKVGKKASKSAVDGNKTRSKGKMKRQSVDNPQPGLQKLKSAFRQTRRLLAKENLAADVRVETERRLKALEADLAKRQVSKKERSLALRYHKIKFFERQKVIRKIRQASKNLASSSTGRSAELGNALLEARVDLNYILHYPKTKKYISLFPPEVRHGITESTTMPSQSETAKTDRERQEIRNWIRQQMNSGDLSTEPEIHLDVLERRSSGRNDGGTSKSRQGVATSNMDRNRPASEKNAEKLPAKHVSILETDEFFEADDDNSESDDEDDDYDSDDETSS